MLLVIGIVVALVLLSWPWSLVAITAAALGEVGVAAVGLRWSRRRRPRVGVETLLGAPARTLTPLSPDGQVKVNGEIWNARADGALDAGEPVRVRSVEGLTLDVEPR